MTAAARNDRDGSRLASVHGMEPLVRPLPTDEEMAAIAAMLATADRGTAAPAPETGTPMWNLSGRWWAVPIPARRARPWM